MKQLDMLLLVVALIIGTYASMSTYSSIDTNTIVAAAHKMQSK